MLPILPATPEALLRQLQDLEKSLGRIQINLFMLEDEGSSCVPAFLRAIGPNDAPEDLTDWARPLQKNALDLQSLFTHRDLPHLLNRDYLAMVPPRWALPGEAYSDNAKTIFKAVRHLNHLASEILFVVCYQIEGIRDISKECLCSTWYKDLTTFGTEEMDLLMPRRAEALDSTPGVPSDAGSGRPLASPCPLIP